MTTVFDVKPELMIKTMKEDLKNISEIKPTEWAKFVKTRATANKPPEQDDFWYIRTASMLRKMYIWGVPVGTQKLKVKYGGKKDTGDKPDRFGKGGGSIIRKILQQLESAGFIKKVEVSGKKGRMLTKKGKSYVDKIAAKIAKEGQ
ncbi:MAG TPA: 30S ribosomal protein S19e [Candidatus Woesearchaeota archaeon]|nr:30S ribosomal protein S19e [Candidatus Woesearchaeota archaeon]